MKKLKTRKALAKRFKLTKTGKLMRRGKPAIQLTGAIAKKIKKQLG